MDGIIDRYKVRLVAKGYTQLEGLNFFGTFSLVAMLTTIRFLLAIATVNNWYLGILKNYMLIMFSCIENSMKKCICRFLQVCTKT